MSGAHLSYRQRRRLRGAVLTHLRAEYDLLVTAGGRITARTTPTMASLVLAAWDQPDARWIDFMGVKFPVRGGDDWARTVLDPSTRQPLFSTSGGWLV